MEITVPKNIYKMVDEYSAAAREPVSESERDAVARLMYELVQRLMKNGFTPREEALLAKEAGVNSDRIPEIGQFLASWGLDDE